MESELFTKVAMSFLNTPYKWGGKSPLGGIDCSGMACEMLSAFGAIPRNIELNSQALFELFKVNTAPNPALGDLAFYGKGPGEINHVAVFLTKDFVIEAGHGDSTITNAQAASERDAKVRISPYTYRKDLVAILRPTYLGG